MVPHRIYNFKSSVPLKNSYSFLKFYNGSTYNYHFIRKELADEFEKQFLCLEEDTEKDIAFTVPKEEEVTRVHGMKKNLQQIYPADCNLLIGQYLWQTHYLLLLINFLKKFIKINVNTDLIIKNVKRTELNINILTSFLNTQNIKMI